MSAWARTHLSPSHLVCEEHRYARCITGPGYRLQPSSPFKASLALFIHLISPAVWIPPRWSPCDCMPCCSRRAGWSERWEGHQNSGSSLPCPSWICTRTRVQCKPGWTLLTVSASRPKEKKTAYVMTGCLVKSGSQAPVSLLEIGQTCK